MQRLVQEEHAVITSLVTVSEDLEPLLLFFEQIAQEQDWRPGDQLRAYQDRSVYFALHRDGRLIGGLQLVPGRVGEKLPCQSVWPELELAGRDDIANIALLALDKPVRGKNRLFWLLCVEMWRYCRAKGITTLWMEVTPANLRCYHRLGWPLHVAGPLRSHWGENCFPCCMNVREVEEAVVQKARLSSAYQAIVQQAYRAE